MSETRCEGNCEVRNAGHRGSVRRVVVWGNGSKPMAFDYCERAIEEDRSNGFAVDPACTACNGSGVIEVDTGGFEPWGKPITDGATCPECNGNRFSEDDE